MYILRFSLGYYQINLESEQVGNTRESLNSLEVRLICVFFKLHDIYWIVVNRDLAFKSVL